MSRVTTAPRTAEVGEEAFHHILLAGAEIDRATTSLIEVGARSLTVLARSSEDDADTEGSLETLGLPVDRRTLTADWPLVEALTVVDELLRAGSCEQPPVAVNVAGADRHLSAVGTVAAYARGLPVVDIVGGSTVILPRLELSLEETISETKRSILEGLAALGGRADELKTLAEEADITSSLASYHVRGGQDVDGLEEMGFLTVSGSKVGQLQIELTWRGRLVAERLIPTA